uniref:Variant surface glycoprotein 1125.333 n=1 Tax=Trypanosoma brucei TaxID=5691 RepID=A0A1J0R5P3_9TRYP|nr:variant surface glycoprotein 1125.333 [Trypanosoma brucei]
MNQPNHDRVTRQMLLVLLIQGAMNTAGTAAATIHPVDKTPKTPCGAAADLQEIASKITSKVKIQRNNIRKAMKTLLVYATGAAASTEDTALGSAALLIAAGAKIEEAQTKLTAVKETAQTVTANLHKLAGVQTTIAEVAATAIEAKPGATAATWLGRDGVQIKLNSLGGSKQICHNPQQETDWDNKAKEQSHGLYPIVLFQLKEAAKATGAGTAGPRVCGGGVAAVTNTCPAMDSQGTTDLTLIGGKLTTAEPVTYKPTSDSDRQYKPTPETASKVMPPQELATAALAQLHTVTEQISKLSFSADSVSATKLAASSEVTAVLTALLKLQSKKPKETNPDPGEITKLKNRLYGTESGQQGKALWETITKIPSSNAIAEGNEDPTSETQNIAQLAKTVGYYISKATKTTSKQAQCPSNKAEPACATLSREKCTDLCEWQGSEEKGKCQAKGGEKEEVKAQNDGKTTNNTGSNSFVIKKAPLWLAVLLTL